MEKILADIRRMEKQSLFTVVLNGWGKKPFTVGYCQSKKTGKWGAYRRFEHSLETIVCESEKEAAEAVRLFLI